MTITALALRENELYAEVLSVNGSMQEKHALLEALGVYEKFKQVHNEYARLCDTDLEALKRGLFIQWYSLSEPNCFTGIFLLNSFAVKNVLDCVYRHLLSNEPDFELRWMLSYYSEICEFMFEEHLQLKLFYENLNESYKVDLPDCIDREAMKSRGQMGIYWNSINGFNDCPDISKVLQDK